jgi:hypothetical protein
MNHPWQQPIRPLEVLIPNTDLWATVLFIRPRTDRGWEVTTLSGNVWNNLEAELRYAQGVE